VIYNATSGGNALLPPQDQECDWIDIVQVPLASPGAASHVRREPLVGRQRERESVRHALTRQEPGCRTIASSRRSL
jgi:hypothetical protein